MKKYLFLLILVFPVSLFAQDDQRYLAGAVQTENGKVVFSKEIVASNLTQDELFDKLLYWGEQRFKTEQSRVAYHDKSKGDIAITGMDTIVFASTALALDQSIMTYRMIMKCKGNNCKIQISNIRYEYNVSYQREPERYVAEDIITDKYALNKNKLNRLNGKFRKETINYVDEMFGEIDKALGVVNPPVAVAPVEQPVSLPKASPRIEETRPVTTPTTAREGYMAFEAGKVPQALLALLPESPLRVTPGTKSAPIETNVSWKGFNTMFGKTVTTISLSEASVVYKEVDGLYTISFLKETTDKEPWMIVECQKQGETTEGTQKTIIGEVLQIWIK